MSKLNFTVKPSGLKGYWIAVGNKDVDLVNRVGSIPVTDGAPHILVWWMKGNPGGSLAISGTLADGTEVVSIKSDDNQIPDDKSSWANIFEFDMPEKRK